MSPVRACRDGCGADALERLHEARFARERLAGFDMRRDLGLKRSQGFAKAGDMRLEASADADMAGMLQPVGFGEEHLLELVAPGFQVFERQDLGRRSDRFWREGRDAWRNGERAIREPCGRRSSQTSRTWRS